jgi:hypothetical protein
MAFRLPPAPLLLLLLGSACYDGAQRTADTASAPEADADTDVDADTDLDTGNAEEPATAQALCETVFALCEDDWGWSDLDSCSDRWLGVGEEWECEDIPGYLACAAPCLEAADCDAFGACEVPCWDSHCL